MAIQDECAGNFRISKKSRQFTVATKPDLAIKLAENRYEIAFMIVKTSWFEGGF